MLHAAAGSSDADHTQPLNLAIKASMIYHARKEDN